MKDELILGGNKVVHMVHVCLNQGCRDGGDTGDTEFNVPCSYLDVLITISSKYLGLTLLKDLNHIPKHEVSIR